MFPTGATFGEKAEMDVDDLKRRHKLKMTHGQQLWRKCFNVVVAHNRRIRRAKEAEVNKQHTKRGDFSEFDIDQERFDRT